MSADKNSGKYVTWEMAAGGIFTLMLLLAGFATWIISRSEEAVAAGNDDTKAAVLRVETKLDHLMLLLLKKEPPERP